MGRTDLFRSVAIYGLSHNISAVQLKKTDMNCICFNIAYYEDLWNTVQCRH